MSISSNTNRVQYAGDGSTTAFTSPNGDEFLVYVTDTNGTITLQDLGVDYTVNEFNEVVFNTAPSATDTITILIGKDFIQAVNLTNNSGFDAETIEGALDDATLQILRVDEEVGRALKLPVDTEITDTTIESIGAGKYLRVNDAGDGFEAVAVELGTGTTLSNITGGTGVMVQTSSSNYTARTITGSTNITVTNGSGVSGNPTISLADNITINDSLTIGDGSAAGHVDLLDPTGAYYVRLAAPALSANVTFNLPTADGTSGQVLKTDGAGNLDWVANSSTPPSAAGSNTQIQYNNAGAFAGDSGFTTNGSGTVTINGLLNVDNLRLNGNDITATNLNGSINLAPQGTGVFAVTGTQTISGQLNVDNLNINGNTISSTNTNGDITLDPNGTGKVIIGNLSVTADTASPALNQVLYCSSTTGNVISLGDNAATSTTYGQVQLYDAADGSTSTSTAATQVLTPGGVRNLDCVAQGWVRFDGTGTPAQIDGNYNFTSITDNGTGDYSIDFSDALAASNEFCVSITGSTTIGYYLSSGSDTNTVHIQMKNDAGTLTDDAHISVIVFGRQ